MIYVVERKTTSESIELGGTYWKRLNLDPQISLYTAAVRQLGYGDVRGILYDVLRKPAHRPSQAKSETPDAYGKRALEAITEAPEKFYQRGVITRLASELDEAKADVWQTAVALRDARRLKVFPRNPDACVQWSHACDYLSVCCGEASIDDPVLFRRQEKKYTELDAANSVTADGEVVGLELVTQSSLRCFRACHRKYQYRYEMQMRPLAPEAEPLRQGKSIHKALEVWSTSGGDLEKSLTFLDKEDPYKYAKEAAMIVGYHARWPAPTGVIAVEKEWSMDLVNPETGAASRTFRLGGRVDAIVELEA